MQNRNPLFEPTYIEGGAAWDATSPTGDFDYDSFVLQHPVPQNEIQYAWITASSLDSIKTFPGYISDFTVPTAGGKSAFPEQIDFLSSSGYASYVWTGGGDNQNKRFFARVISNVPADAESIDGNASRSEPIPIDFVGLNTNIYEPLTASMNLLGYPLDKYPDASKESGQEYINKEFIYDDDSNSSGVFAFNALMLHRRGPHGYPMWKQIRGSEHPIVRSHRRNNIYSVSFKGLQHSPSAEVGSYDRHEAKDSIIRTRDRIVKNYKEVPVSAKYYPLLCMDYDDTLLRKPNKIFDSHAGTISQQNEEKLWTQTDLNTLETSGRDFSENLFFVLKDSYSNELTTFANKELSHALGVDENKYTFFDSVISEFSKVENNPPSSFSQISYMEAIFPKEVNSFLKESRYRENFVFNYKKKHKDREEVLTGSNHYGPGTNSADVSDKDYVHDATNQGEVRFNNPNFRRITANKDNFENANSMFVDAVDYYLDNSNNAQYQYITQSAWPLDSRKDFSSLPTCLTMSFVGSQNQNFEAGGRDQGKRGEGEFQNDYSIYHMGISRLHGMPPAGLVYNRRVPQKITISGAESEYLAGEARWQAAEQSGNHPFEESYNKYSENVRTVGKGYSIIPEFRISEHLQNIVDSNTGRLSKERFNEPIQNLLTLTGAINSQDPEGTYDVGTAGNFYKSFASSDFLKYFTVINDTSNSSNVPISPHRVTLKCSAVMKFLPYEGFYPAERTRQIGNTFARNYLSSFNYRQTDGVDISNSLDKKLSGSLSQAIKPLAAPGILFNSIKSGLAVDYPIFENKSKNSPAAMMFFLNFYDDHFPNQNSWFRTNGLPRGDTVVHSSRCRQILKLNVADFQENHYEHFNPTPYNLMTIPDVDAPQDATFTKYTDAMNNDGQVSTNRRWEWEHAIDETPEATADYAPFREKVSSAIWDYTDANTIAAAQAYWSTGKGTSPGPHNLNASPHASAGSSMACEYFLQTRPQMNRPKQYGTQIRYGTERYPGFTTQILNQDQTVTKVNYRFMPSGTWEYIQDGDPLFVWRELTGNMGVDSDGKLTLDASDNPLPPVQAMPGYIPGVDDEFFKNIWIPIADENKRNLNFNTNSNDYGWAMITDDLSTSLIVWIWSIVSGQETYDFAIDPQGYNVEGTYPFRTASGEVITPRPFTGRESNLINLLLEDAAAGGDIGAGFSQMFLQLSQNSDPNESFSSIAKREFDVNPLGTFFLLIAASKFITDAFPSLMFAWDQELLEQGIDIKPGLLYLYQKMGIWPVIHGGAYRVADDESVYTVDNAKGTGFLIGLQQPYFGAPGNSTVSPIDGETSLTTDQNHFGMEVPPGGVHRRTLFFSNTSTSYKEYESQNPNQAAGLNHCAGRFTSFTGGQGENATSSDILSKVITNMTSSAELSQYGLMGYGTAITGSIINDTAEDSGPGPRIKSKVNKRITFEEFLDPKLLVGTILHDNEPHPSAALFYGNFDYFKTFDYPAVFGKANLEHSDASLGLVDFNLNCDYIPYKLAINNFVSETVNFFLENKSLTSMESGEIDFQGDGKKTLKMRVSIKNRDNVMYDRKSAFGPPVNAGVYEQEVLTQKQQTVGSPGVKASGNVDFNATVSASPAAYNHLMGSAPEASHNNMPHIRIKDTTGTAIYVRYYDPDNFYSTTAGTATLTFGATNSTTTSATTVENANIVAESALHGFSITDTAHAASSPYEASAPGENTLALKYYDSNNFVGNQFSYTQTSASDTNAAATFTFSSAGSTVNSSNSVSDLHSFVIEDSSANRMQISYYDIVDYLSDTLTHGEATLGTAGSITGTGASAQVNSSTTMTFNSYATIVGSTVDAIGGYCWYNGSNSCSGNAEGLGLPGFTLRKPVSAGDTNEIKISYYNASHFETTQGTSAGTAAGILLTVSMQEDSNYWSSDWDTVASSNLANTPKMILKKLKSANGDVSDLQTYSLYFGNSKSGSNTWSEQNDFPSALNSYSVLGTSTHEEHVYKNGFNYFIDVNYPAASPYTEKTGFTGVSSDNDIRDRIKAALEDAGFTVSTLSTAVNITQPNVGFHGNTTVEETVIWDSGDQASIFRNYQSGNTNVGYVIDAGSNRPIDFDDGENSTTVLKDYKNRIITTAPALPPAPNPSTGNVIYIDIEGATAAEIAIMTAAAINADQDVSSIVASHTSGGVLKLEYTGTGNPADGDWEIADRADSSQPWNAPDFFGSIITQAGKAGSGGSDIDSFSGYTAAVADSHAVSGGQDGSITDYTRIEVLETAPVSSVDNVFINTREAISTFDGSMDDITAINGSTTSAGGILKISGGSAKNATITNPPTFSFHASSSSMREDIADYLDTVSSSTTNARWAGFTLDNTFTTPLVAEFDYLAGQSTPAAGTPAHTHSLTDPPESAVSGTGSNAYGYANHIWVQYKTSVGTWTTAAEIIPYSTKLEWTKSGFALTDATLGDVSIRFVATTDGNSGDMWGIDNLIISKYADDKTDADIAADTRAAITANGTIGITPSGENAAMILTQDTAGAAGDTEIDHPGSGLTPIVSGTAPTTFSGGSTAGTPVDHTRKELISTSPIDSDNTKNIDIRTELRLEDFTGGSVPGDFVDINSSNPSVRVVEHVSDSNKKILALDQNKVNKSTVTGFPSFSHHSTVESQTAAGVIIGPSVSGFKFQNSYTAPLIVKFDFAHLGGTLLSNSATYNFGSDTPETYVENRGSGYLQANRHDAMFVQWSTDGTTWHTGLELVPGEEYTTAWTTAGFKVDSGTVQIRFLACSNLSADGKESWALRNILISDANSTKTGAQLASSSKDAITNFYNGYHSNSITAAVGSGANTHKLTMTQKGTGPEGNINISEIGHGIDPLVSEAASDLEFAGGSKTLVAPTARSGTSEAFVSVKSEAGVLDTGANMITKTKAAITSLNSSYTFTVPTANRLTIHQTAVGTAGNTSGGSGAIDYYHGTTPGSNEYQKIVETKAGGSSTDDGVFAGGVNSGQSVTTWIYERSKQNVTGSGYAPYTPPFLDPGASPYIEFTLRPRDGHRYSWDDVMREVKTSYVNFKLAPSNHQNTAENVNENFLYSMNLEASLDWHAGYTVPDTSFEHLSTVDSSDLTTLIKRPQDERYKKKWVIQTKWETPILDFGGIEMDALKIVSGQQQLTSSTESPWEPERWNNYLTSTVNQNPIEYVTGSRGMWHQFGAEPLDQNGYYLEISDVEEDGVESLATAVGFKSGDRITKEKKIGKVASKREISEAVVAIPYYTDSNKNVKFFTLSQSKIFEAREENERIRKIVMKEINEEPDFPLYNAKFSQPSNPVAYQMRMMERYVFPPQFDFVAFPEKINNDEAVAMYVFEFKAELNKQDLINIWQNIGPTSSASCVTAQHSSATERPNNIIDTQYISHELGLGHDNLLSNDFISERVRWLVFKVKRKASGDYSKIKINSLYDQLPNKHLIPQYWKNDLSSFRPDPEMKEIHYSYNWPYDFFSLVELVKIDAKVDYKKKTTLA